MWVHTYACGGQKSTLSITPQGPSIHLIFFFTCSSHWPKVWWLGKDGWSLNPKNCLSLPPQARTGITGMQLPQDWNYRPAPPTMAFSGVIWGQRSSPDACMASTWPTQLPMSVRWWQDHPPIRLVEGQAEAAHHTVYPTNPTFTHKNQTLSASQFP